jgi:hypothetical protein
MRDWAGILVFASWSQPVPTPEAGGGVDETPERPAAWAEPRLRRGRSLVSLRPSAPCVLCVSDTRRCLSPTALSAHERCAESAHCADSVCAFNRSTG